MTYLRISGWMSNREKRPSIEFWRNRNLWKRNSLKREWNSILWLDSLREFSGRMMRMNSEKKGEILWVTFKKLLLIKKWGKLSIMLMTACLKTKKSKIFAKICSEKKGTYLKSFWKKGLNSKKGLTKKNLSSRRIPNPKN